MTALTPPTSSSLRTLAWTPETALAQPLRLEAPNEPLTAFSQLTSAAPAGSGLHLVSLPAPVEEQPELAELARAALVARGDLDATAVTLLGLQGAHLVVAPGWVVAIAAPDRVELAARAAAATCLQESELRRIEEQLGAAWAPLRAASPAAFEATLETIQERAEHQARYAELLSLRETHARLGPTIHVPHVYPPTLESQVGERLRERLRMFERHELLEPVLVAQEQVHALIAERIGESLNARKGHLLEWGIILLLGAEVLLMVADSLVSSAP